MINGGKWVFCAVYLGSFINTIFEDSLLKIVILNKEGLTRSLGSKMLYYLITLLSLITFPWQDNIKYNFRSVCLKCVAALFIPDYFISGHAIIIISFIPDKFDALVATWLRLSLSFLLQHNSAWKWKLILKVITNSNLLFICYS